MAAALHNDWEQRIEVAGHTLILRPGSSDDPAVLLPLARVQPDGTTDLLPAEGDDLLCLAESGEPPAVNTGLAAHSTFRRRPRRLSVDRIGALSLSILQKINPRLLWLVGVLALLTVLSTFVFHRFDRLSWLDAVYFTVTIITTTGFGDIHLRDAPAGVKLFGISLMLLGAAGLAVFYALIIDALVGARLTRAFGGLPRQLRDHVVVCGLGNVGYRVVEQLSRLDVPVVAVELHEESDLLAAARQLGVPVLIADARQPATLQRLHVREARCLVVATDDDLANLETALNARTLNPDLRIVLRLFDPDRAGRVERTFGIHISRSVSALAAPAFAAAATGRQIIATLPAGNRVLIIAEIVVEAGCRADGQRVEGH